MSMAHSQAGRASSFAAQVRLSSKLPTLILEDLEHHIERIECHDSTVKLRFPNAETVKLAHEEFMKAEKFYLITSHEGCNNDGERDVHLVSTASLTEDLNTIVLSVTRMSWETTFHKMDVQFGDSEETFEVRRHVDLRKRQDTTTEMTTSTVNAASPSTIGNDFPPAPTSSPGNFEASKEIASELIDTQILPPASDINVDFSPIPEAVESMTVKCKNCSVQGTLSLYQGFFSVQNTRESEQNESMIIEFFKEDGFLELQADNVAAHIELESSVNPSVGLGAIEIPLPSIGLPGFTIPGIATVGPLFRPVIEMGAQLSAQVDFTYGFDLTIPNNSTITVHVANLTNSSETGFRDASLTALPFQASIPSVSLTLSLGFLPRLLLGIDVGSAGRIASGNAGAGFILGLPKLAATISQVQDVNERCESANATSTGDDDDDDEIFDSLTLIEPSVILDVGLIAEAGVGLAGGKPIEFNAEYGLLNKTFELPTACLRFDAESGGYAPAVTAAAAAGEGVGSGGVRLGMVGLKVLAGLLVAVFVVVV